MKLFITQENLETLIKNLKKSCDELIGPKKEHLGDIIFGDVKDNDGLLSDYEGNSIVSPRAFLLPQTEELFEIRSARNSSLRPIRDKKARIFYGVRPCDIKAILFMRSFFLDEFCDDFYKEKLENSVFIALACNKRCLEEAFCSEIGSGPIAREGFDLQLIGLRRGYLVEAGSEKGGSIIRSNKKLFAKSIAEDEKELKANLKNFTQCAPKKIDYKKVAKIISEDKVSGSIWQDIGLRCVICSGCVTLCPTCSCFSITDRLSLDKGVRLRYCDGCPYAGFTRMAGGRMPEALHKDHIRRFFEHKLSIDVARYGIPSCVGCARCIKTCPGNINIRKFIHEVASLSGGGNGQK